MLPIITFEDLQSCPLGEALAGVSNRARDYSHALNIHSKKYAEDSSQRKTLNFLSALCGMMLNTNNTGPVFKPVFEFENGRSPLPEDIPEENFDPLFTFGSTLGDCILRARIMDILWIRRTPNRISAAKSAITSYLECANLLNFEPYECIPYLQRALNITYELGKTGNELHKSVSIVFEQAIQQYNPDELNGLHHKMCFVMAEREIGDQEKLYQIMIQAASAHEASSSFHLMRGFLELARMFAKNAKHTKEEIKKLLVREAESYVQEANAREHAMAKSHFLEQAIQAYRSIGGHERRVEALHKEMLSTQKRIPEFLTESVITLPDMSDVIEEARKAISGKEIFDALTSLALITVPLDPVKERANAVKRAKEFPLSSLFSQRHMDKNGKTVSLSDGIGTQEVTGDEPAIYADMLRNTHLNIHITLYSSILPALKALLEEHEIDDTLLADIVKNNQLVPAGRELFFFRGIKAGFEYDFVTASLFLIPQLENSLRCIMEQNGIITSKLTSTGIQREKDLNDLFDEEFVKGILGEKYIFTLKALLTEQEGANLRNKLAHGLAEYNQLQGDASAFFWWITLRLLLTPFIQQQKHHETG